MSSSDKPEEVDPNPEIDPELVQQQEPVRRRKEIASSSAKGAGKTTIASYAKLVVTILIPVVITMACVIALVKGIKFGDGESTSIIFVYKEEKDDSNSLKFGGAILNAIIFIAAILLITCIFVAFLVLDAANSTLDWISVALLLWNFCGAGIISIFWVSPRIVNQFYMIAISTLMAAFFTRLPEWTTWTILIAMALYDLFAVLTPKGPLKLLVELASERNEPIPALVYNATVTMAATTTSDNNSSTNTDSDTENSDSSEESQKSKSSSSSDTSDEAKPLDKKESKESDVKESDEKEEEEEEEEEEEKGDEEEKEEEEEEKQQEKQENVKKVKHKHHKHKEETNTTPANQKPPVDPNEIPQDDDDGIKLGLGDFVFYSVLIGRAAMYDMITVFTCFFAIVTGLFGTLMILAVVRRALPALPFSIALGTIFYFLTRFIIMPFVANIGVNSFII